jgi:hypothetical protein
MRYSSNDVGAAQIPEEKVVYTFIQPDESFCAIAKIGEHVFASAKTNDEAGQNLALQSVVNSLNAVEALGMEGFEKIIAGGFPIKDMPENPPLDKYRIEEYHGL